MFHSWELAKNSSPEPIEAFGSGAAKRPAPTSRACEPCRRRKIRCNGELPCETCQWYHKAASCYYTEPRQRKMPCRKDVEASVVLQRLFPATPLEQLTVLSRDRLIELLAKNSPLQQQPLSPITPDFDEQPPVVSPDAANLEQLQPMPEDGTDGTDSRSSGVQGVTDDINALSLSVSKSSSYLGISSVMAVLRVILWLDPAAQAFFTKISDRNNEVSRTKFSWQEITDLGNATDPIADAESPSAWEEIPLINAYFDYIHTFVPLIDEQYFRNTYLSQKRTDARWLLLLNTVLALGGMAAASSCEDLSHVVYYKRASQHLTVETLGALHIETVQALALLGGYYLHYLNKPHVAHNLMGATLRMATALGLHRDYSEGIRTANAPKAAYTTELRRRVWWNIFIMDAWHGAAIGRPSMGRMSAAISAKPPQEPIDQSESLLAIVQENVRFCIISTKMEDALAVSPLIAENERLALDNSFVMWFQTSSVQNNTPRAHSVESQGVTMSKSVMRWRYLLWRIIIHRPILLWYAMHTISYETLPQDKKHAIELCRELAGELINDIATTWKGQKVCQMAGWNATWNLYQTLMVPLLSLFSDYSDSAVVANSRAQIEQGLVALTDLRDWSNIARRCYEVVSRIYEASKRYPAKFKEQQLAEVSRSMSTSTSAYPADLRPANDYTTFSSMQPNVHHGQRTASQVGLVDDMFDSLNWSTGFGADMYQFGTNINIPGWDYDATNEWSENTTIDPFFAPVFMEGDDGSSNIGMNFGNGGGEGTGRPPDEYLDTY